MVKRKVVEESEEEPSSDEPREAVENVEGEGELYEVGELAPNLNTTSSNCLYFTWNSEVIVAVMVKEDKSKVNDWLSEVLSFLMIFPAL